MRRKEEIHLTLDLNLYVKREPDGKNIYLIRISERENHSFDSVDADAATRSNS